MAKKNGKAIAVVVSILAIVGVVGYVLYRRKKELALLDQAPSQPENTPYNQPNTTPANTTAGSGYSFPFKTIDEGNKFRAWVNYKYPAYAKQISLDKTGQLNSYLEKAWKQYGGEYTVVVLKPNTPSQSQTGPKKVWTTEAFTGLYKNPDDSIPYRNAGKSEYIGTTDGKSYFDFGGTKYYQIKGNWGGVTTLYVKQQYVTFKQP